MRETLFWVLMLPIPVVGLAVGACLCAGQLRRAGLQFNYSLLDCLAISLSFVPTCGLLACLFRELSSDYLAHAIAMATSIVCTQVLGLVVGRTSALVHKKEGRASSASVLLTGLAGLFIGCLYLLVYVVLAVIFFAR